MYLENQFGHTFECPNDLTLLYLSTKQVITIQTNGAYEIHTYVLIHCIFCPQPYTKMAVEALSWDILLFSFHETFLFTGYPHFMAEWVSAGGMGVGSFHATHCIWITCTITNTEWYVIHMNWPHKSNCMISFAYCDQAMVHISVCMALSSDIPLETVWRTSFYYHFSGVTVNRPCLIGGSPFSGI